MNDVPTISIARPEDVEVKPTIALHLMVKNGESVVSRLIDQVAPYINEVVAVLNDCTDDTGPVLKAECLRHSLALETVEVTSAKYPSLYLLDVPETYQVGEPLAGEGLGTEKFEGPFTGRPILADWAAARNLGWERPSTCEWKLFLDADDVMDDPHCLPGLCHMLEDLGIHVVASRYHYDRTKSGKSRADAFRERLARNIPGIRWHGVVHECLTGYAPGRAAHVDGNLVVRDLRDSTGAGIRIPGRNLKILYHRALRKNWALTSREMVYLAAEARFSMPQLAARLCEMCVDKSTWPEEKAWACNIRGELAERVEDFEQASEWYETSLIHHPGVLSAFRLARSRFHEKFWQAVVEAYETGIKNKEHPQLLDGGEIYEDATKIFVAVALDNLGRHDEAVSLVKSSLEAFSGSAALRELSDRILAKKGS